MAWFYLKSDFLLVLTFSDLWDRLDWDDNYFLTSCQFVGLAFRLEKVTKGWLRFMIEFRVQPKVTYCYDLLLSCVQKNSLKAFFIQFLGNRIIAMFWELFSTLSSHARNLRPLF